jgi:sigma54-dependent transcription regulator
MAIAGAAQALRVGATAEPSSKVINAAQTAADGRRTHEQVRKKLDRLRFTARDCITAWMAAAASSRALILLRNCGIGPGHGVAVICAD